MIDFDIWFYFMQGLGTLDQPVDCCSKQDRME